MLSVLMPNNTFHVFLTCIYATAAEEQIVACPPKENKSFHVSFIVFPSEHVSD